VKKLSKHVRDQAAQLANEAGHGELLFTVDEEGTLLEVPGFAGLRFEREGRDVQGVLRDLAEAMGPPPAPDAEELELLRSIGGGADVWERGPARVARQLEKKGLVKIVEAMANPPGHERQPYFGCVPTAAGKKARRGSPPSRLDPALRVNCPICRVDPGALCVEKKESGRYSTREPHPGRVDEAKAQAKVELLEVATKLLEAFPVFGTRDRVLVEIPRDLFLELRDAVDAAAR